MGGGDANLGANGQVETGTANQAVFLRDLFNNKRVIRRLVMIQGIGQSESLRAGHTMYTGI